MTLPPDWRTRDLPPDPEWRIAWHKFYFGLDLSHAFAVTGQRRFFEVWRQLVLSFIDQIRADAEADIHVVSRRVLNWLYAWTRFASIDGYPGLGAEDAERVADYLTQQIAHIRAHLSPKRNHRTIELTALLHAALALPDMDAGGNLLAFSIDSLYSNLCEDILEDGVHAEGSTHYHMITLRNFLGARVNAQRYGAQFPAEFDRRLERACEFAMHCHRPDGGIPALSDSDAGSYLDLLSIAADLFGREDFRYAATRGCEGRPPETNASFPHGGYFIQRSSWTASDGPPEDARYLIWDCGAPGVGGHAHYDALHFEASAYGRPLVIDPGRYTYSEAAPNWRRWFKGTGAHNTVQVNGKDQVPYASWDGASVRVQAEARFHGRWIAPGLDFLSGSITSRCYSAQHRRRILFVAGEYWLIEDLLEDRAANQYDLRFHLSAAAQGHTTRSECDGVFVIHSPGLVIACIGGMEADIEDGWAAPSYGVKVPAPVVSLRAEGDTARFLSLIFPIAEGTEFMTLKTDRVGNATVVWKRGSAGYVDAVVWDDEAVHPHAAWVRRDA